MKQATNQAYHELDRHCYLQAFKRYPLVLDRGQGSRVWDIEGNEFIDALAGIAVTSVGHSHPTVVDAVCAQTRKLIHISNFYVSVPQARLSEKLVALSGMDRVFLANSGAEAVEGAIKIARKYAHSVGRGGTVISFTGSFHGRTMATIAMGKEAMQKGFEPIPGGFIQARFNDIDSVRSAVTKDTAAIVIEPIQGEGGIHTADRDFLKQLRALCDREKIVLVFDEIQCGMGRTGRMFAKEHYDVQPDIMTLAKALGGGVPIGAVLSSEAVSSAIEYGDHGTTFGGNPLACAAALAVLKVIEEDQLLRQATEKFSWFKEEILRMEEPSIREIRGLGLMIGIEFDFDTKPLVLEMMNRGVLANATADTVLRLVPPLNISYNDMEEIIRVLKEALRTVKSNG